MKSGACKGGAVEKAKKVRRSNLKEVDWKNYQTRRDYCEQGLNGRWFTSNDCQLRDSYAKSLYKKNRIKLADKEYDQLKKKWGSKNLSEICKTMGKKPHGRSGCWFSTGGIENNVKQMQVQFYLSERKKRDKADYINKTNSLKLEYRKLSAAARAKKLKGETGFYVDVTKVNTGWDKAKTLCSKRGLNLPSVKHLKKFGIHLLAYQEAMTESKSTFYSYVSDEIGAEGMVTKKGNTRLASKNSWGGIPLACKQLSPAEQQALAQKEAAERKLIQELGTSTPLEFLQKVVTVRDNYKLKLVSKYSKANRRIADGWATFESAGNGWTSTQRYISHSRKHEKTANLFSWVFKADAGQKKQYADRMAGKHSMKTYGLTKQGLQSVVANIKSQPLYKSLSNKGVKSDNYSATLYGYFKDQNGRKHIVNYEIMATGTHVSIDYSWRR